MDWLGQISGMLNKYGTGDANAVPDSVNGDFDHVVTHAPKAHLSEGLAEAFRSQRTPPFGNMLGQLFGASGAVQKTSLLNTLVTALGPTVMAQLLSKHGAAQAASELQNRGTVPPEAANQIPASSVESLAVDAEKANPSIVDRVSDFYAEQPALVKTLGGVALTVALAKVAQAATGGRR